MRKHPYNTICPWCGDEIIFIMESEGVNFDAALEMHVEDCEQHAKGVNND